MKNYHPVSILLTIPNVFEKVANNQIVRYFNNYNLFYGNQFGFCKESDTVSILKTLINNLSRSLDGEKVVAAALCYL